MKIKISLNFPENLRPKLICDHNRLKKRSGSNLSTDKLKSAGTSLREVRSPDAPKITMTVGGIDRLPKFVIKFL